ncbi:hypothetical protein KBW71_08015 [Hydrogenophaga aromaticivorans]|uniref:CAP domain-containing protein n=1 Tax=Hydrogenophaga aromaticivorans TaxID=2610898 RepID=UPI001B38AA50|nr:CAP domain-containing protein [Hydrogenophaga aromaticivorans]MBQ0918387.1 hypothetical protein [Hydrogenophaga aromaticivorans]
MKSTNRFAQLTLVAASAMLLTACGGGGGDGSSAPVIGQNGAVDVNTVALPAGQTCGVGNYAQALLAAINNARAQARSCGGQAYAAAPAMGWNSLLTQAAVGHSTDMASKGFFSHTGSDGRGYSQRIESTGYSGFPSEVLSNPQGTHSAAGQIIPQSMASWLASPGHCAAIMDPALTEIGSACVKSGSKAYVTVDLGG